MNDSANPLLSDQDPFPFHLVQARHVEPGVREVLERGQAGIDELASDADAPTWESLIDPLDKLTRWVGERLAPATHLISVAETRVLREAYNAVLPELSAFWARLPLNRRLWERLRLYEQCDEAAALEGLRARHLKKTLQEFRRAGADLPEASRKRLEALKIELAQLQQKFSENVLDATAAYELHVENEARLEGVPEAARARYRARAAENDLPGGWVLTLDYPSVEPILKYAHDRELRREIFVAYTSRCREGEHDNRALIVQILALRQELAETLGYDGFPDFRLEDHMTRTGARALEFERDLVERTRPYWERDADELRQHAAALGLERLRPWDVAFVSEHLRRSRYDLDDELLRPYFPLESVMAGLFEVVHRVFGLTVSRRPNGSVWHPDVWFYDVIAEDGTLLGSFYTDWFPRKEKRPGAWMNDLVTGGPKGEGGFEPHLGVVCGNFTPPDGERPALLTHREVQTIFHEFGHLLHHCTSRVPVRGRSGLNVAWDWVELPSQLMENWTWEREALDLFARHFETGNALPADLFQRMTAARRFMGGWAQMRQLSLGSVDLELHFELAPRARHAGPLDVMEFARRRFRRFSPADEFADYHIITSFGHLFSGGYAAAYYSYLWSEVLDADAFTRFAREGIFNRETGRAFMEAILTRGDSDDPEALFREFMGREADPDALLARNLGPPPGQTSYGAAAMD